MPQRVQLANIAPEMYRKAAEMTAEKEGCTVEEAERIGRIATRYNLTLLHLINGGR